jgi:hypothetical protein|tara:strand:- start:2614 stop:2790 length:177 start_codon:yes stop_codon:yes gene_type:complete
MKPIAKMSKSAVIKRLMGLLPKELAVEVDLYNRDTDELSDMYLIVSGELFEIIEDESI